jgi:outer membrane protein OmpA-like peptidoglycan-associated protein
MSSVFKYIRFSVLPFFIIWGLNNVMAQPENNRIKADAKKAFSDKNFRLSLNYYQKLSDKAPDVMYGKAMSYFYLNRFDSSLLHLQNYLRYKKHEDDALYFTGRALHMLNKFEQAVELYRLYLSKASNASIYRNEAKRLLMQAASANKTIRCNQFALLMPLRASLNSDLDDLSPLENPRYSNQLFFSKEIEAKVNIFSNNMQASGTNTAVKLDARYNPLNKQLICAFPDSGYQILYISDTKLMIDNYKDGFDNTLAIPLKGLEEIKMSDCHFVNDSLLLFSSDMPGGYGLLDIYAAYKDKNGFWSNIKNLGPRVNSVFDERTAFLAENSSVLFFSSNRPESIGGFDIFKFDMNKNETPLVFDYPINSTGDDLYFRPYRNKNEIWFSSIRPNGIGAFDNYSLVVKESLWVETNSFNFFYWLFSDEIEKRKVRPDLTSQIDTFYLKAINYDAEGKLEAGSDKFLQELTTFMQKKSDIKILISGHSDDLESKEISLFLTLMEAEKLATVLQKKGVAADRIYLCGLGGQYPAAKNRKFDDSVDSTGIQINKRLEISLFGFDQANTKIIKKEKMISTVLKESAAENYLETIKGLNFKIELFDADNQKNVEFLKNMNDGAVEKLSANSNISFCLGMAKRFDAISILLETVRESGFEKAQIKAYWDGFPVDRNKMETISSDNIEMQKYLNYLQLIGK